MRIADVLLLDLDMELDKTRQLLELVPENKAAWKPHEKSMPLGEIAKHLAVLPGLGTLFLTSDSMDASGGPQPFVFVDKADLFTTFEATSASLRSALAAADDEYLMATWAFMLGDKVLYAAPRAVLYRSMFLNHMVHHRAQLGVYLRLLDIPLPGFYGPSADRPWTP
jgi:uncharacterized damage-inducible protein DinB